MSLPPPTPTVLEISKSPLFVITKLESKSRSVIPVLKLYRCASKFEYMPYGPIYRDALIFVSS